MKLKNSAILFFAVIVIISVSCVSAFCGDKLEEVKSDFRNGKLQKAYDGIKELIEKGDTRKECYIYAGIIYSDIGKHQESIEVLYTGLTIYPDDMDILIIVCRNFIRQKRYIEALETCKSLINRGNKDYKIREYAGDASAGSGNFDDAVYFYKKALDLNREDAWIHIKLARIYKKQKKEKEAVDTLEQGLEISVKKGQKLLSRLIQFELDSIRGKDEK